MGTDISKNTVAILLVIVILLSIAGTWVALNATQTLSVGSTNDAVGEVRVFVQPRPVTIEATGQVALEVLGSQT